ncbi:MAG TPA: hypothetical protein VD788_11470, partial [Candidatus Polarisedimenticolaceae bacterium]|nr:hypothetical protein [Candidatus Polarisedimenticolaceae bacterium]
LTVLLAWLAIAAAWPGPTGSWSRGRLAAVVGIALCSVFCKESWVILPGLVVGFELFIARRRPRRALRTAALLAIPAAAYVVAYPWLFPGRGGYYEAGSWVLAKLPHYWAGFMMLTTVESTRAAFGIAELAALGAIAGCAMIGWRQRSHLVGLGFVFFLCAMAPVLFIPFNPTRYTTAPLVGFVLVMTGTVDALCRWSPVRRRRLALVAAAAGALALFGAGVLLLRGDLADMRRLRASHDELVDEIRAFAPRLPTDRPILCVRMDRVDPLGRLDREGALGLPKLYFKRTVTPYGLADWAQLFTYARAEYGGEIYADLPSPRSAGEGYAIVAHFAGRFALIEPRADSLTAEMAELGRAGYASRLVGPWAPARGTLVARDSHE